VIDLEAAGIEPLVLKDSAGVEGVYALEADSLYGLFELGNAPENSYLCLTGFCGNEDTAAGVIAMLIDMYQTEKPEGYDNRNAVSISSPMF